MAKPDPTGGQTSYAVNGQRAVFYSRVNRPKRVPNYSPLSSAEVKNEWSYNFTPLQAADREDFTFSSMSHKSTRHSVVVIILLPVPDVPCSGLE